VHQIKALLAEKKMTQKEIGEMFGVSVYTISNIKRGISWKE
jgi:transcriptional regulator with XRE-family HTH domain